MFAIFVLVKNILPSIWAATFVRGHFSYDSDQATTKNFVSQIRFGCINILYNAPTSKDKTKLSHVTDQASQITAQTPLFGLHSQAVIRKATLIKQGPLHPLYPSIQLPPSGHC